MVTYVLKEGQHLIVCCVVGNEEAQIGIVQDSCDSDQACSATRDNAHILVGVLALLPFAVVLVVQIRHRRPQAFYTSCRSILSSCHCNIDLLGSFKRALDVIINFWRTLSQVGPLLGLLSEAMLVCAFRTPNDAGGGTSRIETSMRSVAFVGIAKLSVDLRVEL